MKRIFIIAITLLFVSSIGFSQQQQKIFLEHFTNTNCISCASSNSSFYEVLNQNPDLIHLTYHIGLPEESGYFFEQNIEDNTAAQNFYTITEVPSLFANGSIVNNGEELLPQDTLNEILEQNFSSPFAFSSFEIEEQVSGSFKITTIVGTEFTPPEGSYVLKLAVVESEINYTTDNGESIHYNVMRSMLDGFEGKIFDPPPAGNRALFNYSYNLESDWQKENIYTIAWIQNVDTKEIVTAESSKAFIAPLQSSIAELINVSCFEEVDGGINLSVENGESPYTFLWSDGSTDQNLENVSAGIYSVTITDANGATVTEQASVAEPPTYIVDVVVLAESNGNENGKVEISISGATPLVSDGMPYYEIKWSNGIEDSLFIDNLEEGTYAFTITDANNCTYTDEVFVPNNIGELRCDYILNNPLCNDQSSGNIVLSCRNFSPPVLYNWNDGAVNRERFNLKAGTYSVVVTDQLNAVYNLLIELKDPPALKNNLEIVNETGNLDNGAAYANPSGGVAPYSIEWQPSGQTTLFINDLSADNSFGNPIPYVCIVTDNNNCTLQTDFSIQSNDSGLGLNVINLQSVSCFGKEDGEIEIEVSGGNMGYAYDIDWFVETGNTFEEITTSPSSTLILTALQAGTYLAMVTDDDNQTVTDTIKVEQPPLFEISIEHCDVQVDANNNVLENGTAIARAIGGVPPYLYQWSNGGANRYTSTSVSSNLTITVFDANNCQQQQTVFVDKSMESCVLSTNEIILNETSISIYPTLIKNDLSISSLLPFNSIRIFNLNGTTLLQKDYDKASKVYETLPGISNGIYLISVSTNEGIYTQKIMKY